MADPAEDAIRVAEGADLDSELAHFEDMAETLDDVESDMALHGGR